MNIKRRANKVKAWMVEKGITQNQVAEVTGVSPSYVSHTVSGRRDSREVLFYLEARGCNTDDLGIPERYRGGREVDNA